MMNIIYLLIVLLTSVYSLKPSCSTCKFFIPNNDKPELGLCNMFQDKVYNKENNILVNNLAIHCRRDEKLCGESGFLYESDKTAQSEHMENYEYIKNVCSGEFVEDDDLTKLEQLEIDMVSVFQKMRRHNKKIIYNNAKNMYKLIKKREYDM